MRSLLANTGALQKIHLEVKTVIIGLLKTMRPKQWVKNVFIFAALTFDVKLFNPHYLARTVAGSMPVIQHRC